MPALPTMPPGPDVPAMPEAPPLGVFGTSLVSEHDAKDSVAEIKLRQIR